MPIDYSKYPANWLSEIRPRIMKRANNECEICGLKHLSFAYSITLVVRQGNKYKQRNIWFANERDAVRESAEFNPPKKVKVVLTIAHLDHDETNMEVSDDRLKALCQICHLRYDAKEKYRRINEKQQTLL